jgi:hypothetical protein
MQLSLCTVKGGKAQNIQTIALADVQKYVTAVWGAGKK